MNIQNYFVARNNKIFAEFDYAQLEIRVLALASMDKQLILDINNGQDMHRYFASKIYNKPEKDISPLERKTAKGFSFQLQYGAGAKGIARFWDVKEEFTKAFIEEYYSRYPEVRSWQQSVQKEAESTLMHMGDRKDGESVPRFYIPSIWKTSTGEAVTHYAVAGDISKYKDTAYVSPTKVKNYPIQGAASDIMMLMLNKLSAHAKVEKFSLLNTVHDSELCELSEDGAEDTAQKIAALLTRVPSALRVTFGVKSPVEFPVDYSLGLDLFEVKAGG